MKCKSVDYLHKINILVVIALFFYSMWYFIYFQFSLKVNPANLTDLQSNLYVAYWYIMLIYFLLYLVIYVIIIAIIRYRRKKRLKKHENNVETEKNDNFELWLISSILTSILFSFISLLTLIFYDSVSIENTEAIFEVKVLMIVIKLSPLIILVQYPILFELLSIIWVF